MRSHTKLRVYKLAFASAMEIFNLTKEFPTDEKYSLNDQIRRSSRSVCGNIAEAFRKRRYPKAFILSLSHSQGEAAETQTWLEFALKSKYISQKSYEDLYDKYDQIIGMLVNMIKQAPDWKN